MLIPPESHSLIFADIKEAATEERPAISILVAVDTDAICASKILTGLLKTKFIPYVLRPTRGLEDLYEAATEELAKPEIKCLFLINCGGGIDLADFFDLHEGPEEPTVYVLDSHRPFNVKNIHHPNIAIIDDGTLNTDDLPGPEEIQNAMDQDSEDEDDEEEDDDGVDFQERSEEDKRARIRAAKQRRLERLLRKMYKSQIEPRYYVPSGTCAAGLMYEIATQVSQPGNELLWAAIVGLTDQWLHGRISSEKYAMEVEEYRNEVKKYNEDYSDDPALKKARQAASDSTIQPSEEYQFMLYRHWTLYDSMWHSRYIAARLGIWKEHGKKVLDTLLARIGVPLHKCTDAYSAMDVKLKQDMKKNLLPYAKSIGLDGICYSSFIYQRGFQRPISAADKALIVTALLGREQRDDEDGERREWVKHFMDAFDALSTTQRAEDYQRLQTQGIERAISEQKAVIRQGANIIEKKIIRNSGRFRYVILHQTPDLHFFSHSLALCKLALFLVEYLNETNKKQKPFLICAKNEIKNTYLVVGVTSMDRVQSNRGYGNFGRKFRQAALRTGARLCHHGFDSSVVEVAADDIFKFVEFIQAT